MEKDDVQPRGWDEGPGLFQAAWRYNWIVAFAALLGALLGYGWASRQPVLYQGTSRLLFAGSGVPTLPGQASQPSGDPARYLNNQAQLIGSIEVLERAAKRSQVAGATADSLVGQMSVEVEQNADVITISVLDSTPKGAARLANAIGAAYQAYLTDRPGKLAEELHSVNDRLQNRLDEIGTALAATPPPSDAPTLRLERDAIIKQQKTNAEGLAAMTAAGDVNPVQLQELSAVPQQPAQPATRRTEAIGVLFGLVVGVALAWLLSTRRSAAASAAEPAAGSPPRGGAAGRDVTSDTVADEAWPVEAGATDEQGPAAVPTGNGVRSRGADTPMVRSLAREHDIDLDQVQGTGRGGRVRPEDVEAFLQRHQRTYATAVDEAGTGQPPGSNGDDGLIGLFTRLDAALAGEPLHLYFESLPQVIARELTYDAFADFVAVLLENGAGSFEVVGAVGLAADEQHAIVDQRHDVLRQAHQDGVSVFNDTSRLMVAAAAGIPGSQTAEALILVPLVQGPSWIGMLLVGRRSGTGRRATAFDDQEVADVVLYAMDSVPILNSLLLLRGLQQFLAVLDRPASERGAQPR